MRRRWDELREVSYDHQGACWIKLLILGWVTDQESLFFLQVAIRFDNGVQGRTGHEEGEVDQPRLSGLTEDLRQKFHCQPTGFNTPIQWKTKENFIE